MSAVRRYHLGLDWGTSTTKMILRDYEQGRAFVLMHDGGIPTYRYPSSIVLSDDRIFFGFEAEKRRQEAERAIDALKADIYNKALTHAGGTSMSELEDIATLYLAHAISLGRNFAETHAKRDNARALIGITLGVPAEELEQSAFRQIYMRMVRCAYELAMHTGYSPQGDSYSHAQKGLAWARERVETNGGYEATPDSYKQWLRPELAAAMYWGSSRHRFKRIYIHVLTLAPGRPMRVTFAFIQGLEVLKRTA